MEQPKSRIVVLGAGVTGLTTAMMLSRSSKYEITVVAKHMPGDLSSEYASPWAGANYLPFSREGSKESAWERDTWPELERLARDVPESGVHFQDNVIYSHSKDEPTAGAALMGHMVAPEGPWFQSYIPKYKQLAGDELRGYSAGIGFLSVCINTTLYLCWLQSQCLKNGVKFKRGVFKHITEAANYHHSGSKADMLLNCTALGSLKLGGVEDKALVPIRGQTVLVRDDPKIMASTLETDDGDDELTYIMQRGAGGGTILGGCYQKGNWDPNVDPNLANRIMKRAVEVAPALTNGRGFEHLDVIRHNVGFRPSREGGPRIEKDTIDGIKVVHNYGHGGYGYQTSYSCSTSAVKLAEEFLGQP